MLMALGAVVFEVWPLNIDRISSSAETAYAWHEVLGGAPTPEHLGEGENGWRLRGRVFPEKLGGLGDLGRLDQARASGEPQYCMRGDGRVIGWVVIERFDQDESALDPRGAGRMIEFEVELKRAAAPGDASFFSVISGLVQ